MQHSNFQQKAFGRAQKWLEGPYDSVTKSKILSLQDDHPDELIDAFYRDLSFGTGGMRGLMGVGTNRMNIYTIRMATQGVANYLLKRDRAQHRMFIGYDVRDHSRVFAEETARVFAGNGIEAWITREVCPTPLVSFGCRFFQCGGGIVITASHNPPQYNGYKVYGQDGAQVVAPDDEGILQEVGALQSPRDVQLVSLDHSLITWVGEELDEAYLKALSKLPFIKRGPKQITVAYTSLHGTGLRLLPAALKQSHFDCWVVEEQKSFDGHFSTVKSPNPEVSHALSIGIKELLKKHSDLLFATDPDADRLGVVVRDKDRAVLLNGHEIGCLALFHLATVLRKQGKLSSKAACIKTIVTTEMFRAIAEDFGIKCFDVLTGFKYIAERIREWEDGSFQFVFSAEESLGFLVDPFVRDKDATSAACLLAEIGEAAAQEGKTVLDFLYELYRRYGVYRQSLRDIEYRDTPTDMERIAKLMEELRSNPPEKLGEFSVQKMDDYMKEHEGLPKSNVLKFYVPNGKLIVRPSGTEPKVKVYGEMKIAAGANIEASIQECERQLQQLVSAYIEVLHHS